MRAGRIARLVWAAPCSAVGLVAGALVLVAGGSAYRRNGIVEVTYRRSGDACGPLARRLPFRAITLGHVVVAVTAQDLDRCRAHELVHVQQCERWGIAFFPAYVLSSVWQALRGRRAYWDNAFEVEARLREAALREELR